MSKQLTCIFCLNVIFSCKASRGLLVCSESDSAHKVCLRAVLVSAESDSVQCQSILDFRKFNFLTPHSVSLRGVTYFANISTKTNQSFSKTILVSLKKKKDKKSRDAAALSYFKYLSPSSYKPLHLPSFSEKFISVLLIVSSGQRPNVILGSWQ